MEEVRKATVDTLNAVPGLKVEYFEIVNPATMQPVAEWRQAPEGALGCITVYCGDVRLIDNISFPALS